MDTNRSLHRQRVLNLIERPPRAPLGLMWQQRNIRLLLDFQPEARRIRFAGKCPNCQQKTLWSYQLPNDMSYDPDEEDCGYFCGHCKWSNAGVRPVWTRKRGL